MRSLSQSQRYICLIPLWFTAFGKKAMFVQPIVWQEVAGNQQTANCH
jgi:hypothetical protein